MKKISISLLLLILMFTLTACGEKKENVKSVNNDATNSKSDIVDDSSVDGNVKVDESLLLFFI